jgi:hypothetical protein
VRRSFYEVHAAHLAGLVVTAAAAAVVAAARLLLPAPDYL